MLLILKNIHLIYTCYCNEHMSLTPRPGFAVAGTAAYSYMLKMLAEAVDGRALIDYGISLPLPVGPAGHARHHGCEQMYGGIEYGMNLYAGGWWLNRLYHFLDPDLVTLAGDYWFRPNNFTRLISMDGRSRVAKAVVYVNGRHMECSHGALPQDVTSTLPYMGSRVA